MLWYKNTMDFADTLPKTKYHPSTDILRIPEKYRKYRYAKKTQISLDPKKYRYVGVITTFRNTNKLKANGINQ
jgi:hypothetical protein